MAQVACFEDRILDDVEVSANQKLEGLGRELTEKNLFLRKRLLLDEFREDRLDLRHIVRTKVVFAVSGFAKDVGDRPIVKKEMNSFC